ncbi:MAG TPA: mevalonate kinase [Nitrososphaerales archaeon]|nr:mevalonate kinase [Nitrososphaerales archaeon]
MKAIAQAPSKVIITGEHFVVHGSWALAAAIGKKVTVEVEASDRLSVNSGLFGGSSRSALRPVSEVVESMARRFSFNRDLRVSISSEVPGGAGLGSSASTMVAVAAAVSKLQSLELGTKELVECAMVGEEEVHGRPSGIDVAVCAHGGVVLFRPGSVPRRVRLDGRRRVLVVLSGSSRSTKRLIGHVADVKGSLPAYFAGLAESAGDIALLAADRLERGDMKGLGKLLTYNHAVLSAVGVSTPGLDQLVDLLLSLGCYGAKLTGAGGGGSVLAVAGDGKEKRIISEVSKRGFEAFVCVIPVEGVKSWLRP